MLQLQVIGNLGADAEIKDFNGRKCVAFNVAHTERYKDAQGNQVESTTWVSCLWNGDGGKLLQYLKRGTQVFAEGSMSLRVYDSAKAHAKIAGANLSVRHIELVGGKKEDSPAPANGNSQGSPAPAANGNSDDMPF